MKYTQATHDVLQIGGGSGDLKHLILNHKDLVTRFKHTPLAHPVILLIDNDDGANELFSVIKQVGGPAINHASTDPFFKINTNLYIIKTPAVGTKIKTCIEDFFDASVLSTSLDGKSFDPNKKHGDDTKYGKARFAEKVIRPNKNTVDFSRFDQILDRIVDALEDYGT
jgi:hypothetical protein